MRNTLSRSACNIVLAALAATASSGLAAAQSVYLEQGGLVVVQFEAAPVSGDWAVSTATNGWTGAGYCRWDGANQFFPPFSIDFFIDVEITLPGTYVFNLRNRHEDPNPTEENDVWVQLDNGFWEKVFSNGPASVGNWTWESRVDNHVLNFPQQSYVLSAGVHRLNFAGRSTGFKMDRLHLVETNHPDPLNLNLPESLRRVGVEYGNANANSTGLPGRIEAFGSPVALANDLTLHGYQLPMSSIGYFVVGNQQIFAPNPGGSSGIVLVGPALGRYAGNLLAVDGAGRVSMAANLTQLPRPTGPIAVQAGQSWYFQLWHRDSNGGVATSNFSRALAVTFD